MSTRTLHAAQAIGPRPLLWLSAGICCAVLPLLWFIPPWIPLITVGLALWRVRLAWLQKPVPNAATRYTAFALCIAFVHFTQGTLFGSDGAVALLSLLLGLKILELRSLRDYLVATFVAFFVILAFCLFDVSLGMVLYALLPITLLLAGILQASSARNGRRIPLLQSTVAAWRLLLAALPLTILLFLFFPRVQASFVQFGPSSIGVSGFSERVQPGSVTRLALSRDLAFRAEIVGEQPATPELYWRGLVLMECRGLHWERGPQGPVALALTERLRPIQWQRIILQPHNRRWLFALDRPVAAPDGDQMLTTQTLESGTPVNRTRYYRVPSSTASVPLFDSREMLERSLRIDFDPSPRLLAFVNALRNQHPHQPEAIAQAMLDHFTAHFSYSLQPGDYTDPQPIDTFLFERQTGFCEHFAAAFATVMRMAGIPARLVVGYHGGAFNRHGGYWQIRQSDAHAWTEIWLHARGWVRIDPTLAVAPERIQYGMNAYLDAANRGTLGDLDADAADFADSRFWLDDWSRNLTEGWDNLNYQWYVRVVDFDREAQRGLLRSIGVTPGREPVVVTLFMVGGLLLFLLAWWLWHRRSTASHDALTRLALAYCRLLAPHCGRRKHFEPLTTYTTKAAPHLPPNAAAAARTFARTHATLRYQHAPPTQKELRSLHQILLQCKVALHTAR